MDKLANKTQNILPEFQKFLLEKDLVPQKNVQFLHTGLIDSSPLPATKELIHLLIKKPLLLNSSIPCGLTNAFTIGN